MAWLAAKLMLLPGKLAGGTGQLHASGRRSHGKALLPFWHTWCEAVILLTNDVACVFVEPVKCVGTAANADDLIQVGL